MDSGDDSKGTYEYDEYDFDGLAGRAGRLKPARRPVSARDQLGRRAVAVGGQRRLVAGCFVLLAISRYNHSAASPDRIAQIKGLPKGHDNDDDDDERDLNQGNCARM